MCGFLGDFMDTWQEDDQWMDEEPVSLAFDRAFGDLSSSFARYGRPSAAGLDGVIVAFGRDESMVLGLSIDGEAETKAVVRALELIDVLTKKLRGVTGHGSLGGASTTGPDGLESRCFDSRKPTCRHSPIGVPLRRDGVTPCGTYAILNTRTPCSSRWLSSSPTEYANAIRVRQ